MAPHQALPPVHLEPVGVAVAIRVHVEWIGPQAELQRVGQVVEVGVFAARVARVRKEDDLLVVLMDFDILRPKRPLEARLGGDGHLAIGSSQGPEETGGTVQMKLGGPVVLPQDRSAVDALSHRRPGVHGPAHDGAVDQKLIGDRNRHRAGGCRERALQDQLGTGVQDQIPELEGFADQDQGSVGAYRHVARIGVGVVTGCSAYPLRRTDWSSPRAPGGSRPGAMAASKSRGVIVPRSHAALLRDIASTKPHIPEDSRRRPQRVVPYHERVGAQKRPDAQAETATRSPCATGRCGRHR